MYAGPRRLLVSRPAPSRYRGVGALTFILCSATDTTAYPPRMETFWSVLVVAGAGALIWFNLKMHDPQARVRAREARAAAQAQIVCKFCQQRGTVSVSVVS